MYIRSKDEAMAALAEILDLEGRSQQIVQATVKVALCLELEARRFMLDVQAGVIEGGLDAFRKKREDALAHLSETKVRRHAPGIDVKKDVLLDEIGVALDLLKMVQILTDVFPELGQKHPKWEIARFIHENQSYTREAMEAGLRRRGKPEHAALESKVLARIEEKKPWWPEWAESIRQACTHYGKGMARDPGILPAAHDPETWFHIITMSEDRARQMLNRLAGTSTDVADYLGQIRARINLVLTAQQEAGA